MNVANIETKTYTCFVLYFVILKKLPAMTQDIQKTAGFQCLIGLKFVRLASQIFSCTCSSQNQTWPSISP
jgi:hypothetical protein